MAQDCNLGPILGTFYCCFTRMTLHIDTQNRLIKLKSSNILVHTIYIHKTHLFSKIATYLQGFFIAFVRNISGREGLRNYEIIFWERNQNKSESLISKMQKMQHFNILFYLQSNKPKFKCYENQMNRTSLLELQAHTTH